MIYLIAEFKNEGREPWEMLWRLEDRNSSEQYGQRPIVLCRLKNFQMMLTYKHLHFCIFRQFLGYPKCPSVLVSNAGTADGVYNIDSEVTTDWAPGRQVYKHLHHERLKGWVRAKKMFITSDTNFGCYLPRGKIIDGSRKCRIGAFCTIAKISGEMPKKGL